MRIFVTGATGFVGSAVVQELINAGHRVLGLARSDSSAAAVAAAGAEVHRGSLEDLESLRRGALAADGVIHTAFIHDFAKMAASAEVDRRAITALGDALSNSNRPLVVTSPIGVLKSGRVGTESDQPDANSAGAHRMASEQTALALAGLGVRVTLVRLPPSVHGEGDHGFVPALVRVAREKKTSAYIGDGQNRWSAVHRLDAAHLFRLALENGRAGATYHAVAEEGVTTRDIAETIGRKLQVPVVSMSREQGGDHFSWLARFFGNDMPASSLQTQQQLGWRARHPGLIADLEQGHYFESTRD